MQLNMVLEDGGKSSEVRESQAIVSGENDV
jgi:hypothetical protein